MRGPDPNGHGVREPMLHLVHEILFDVSLEESPRGLPDCGMTARTLCQVARKSVAAPRTPPRPRLLRHRGENRQRERPEKGRETCPRCAQMPPRVQQAATDKRIPG